MDFLIKTCQDPSCNVPESQSFGPIELKLWGSCCHGSFCNGEVVAPQAQNESTTAPTVITQPTDSPKHNITNDTQDTFALAEEVTDAPDYEWAISMETTTLQNPLYDYEDEEDSELQGSTNNTLNPRAANLSPPKFSVPFYLWPVALGTAILRMW